MNPYLLGAVVVAAALIFGPIAQAQPPAKVDAVLEARLASGYQGDLPVIVKFAEDVDLKELSKEIKRSLKARYPDPKERKVARKALKRSMLLKEMKAQAKAEKQTVSDYLAANGETGEVTELWIINAVAVELAADLVEGLAALPGVKKVVLDATIQGPGDGTAPTAPTYWNLDMTGAPALWDHGHTGLGVVVALLDTGVDATHPDLGPRWRGGGNSWFDPHGQHGTPGDHHGHGTQVLGLMVAGAAGGYQVGMAPDAQWIAAKIFDNSNEATLSAIHEAYQWVLDPDGDPATDDAPDIVNNSWDLNGSQDQCIQEFAPDIALLKESEIGVAFAAGNYGPDAASSVSPGNDPAVLSVGAVNYYSNLDIMSSRGPNACNGGTYPSLVGPGDGVLTTDLMPGFYNVVSGTSFSVAHLAGGMALLRGAFPDATLTQLETALGSTAVDLGSAGPDNDFGHGLFDVVAAHDWLELEVGGGDGGGEPGSLQLGAMEYSLAEDVASLTVTVTRTGGSTGEVSVDFATGDGLAKAGEDYLTAADTLAFLDGETSATLEVGIVDDTSYEGDEDFSISLSNPQGGATLGSPVGATVTILEDDPEPVTDSDGDGVTDSLDRCPGTPAGEPVDANGCPLGQLDNDGDGVTADLDCDDGDASVYPGAPEVKHDGVDQDCNGYDLTIDVTRARYKSSHDKLVVLATSDLGGAADLSMEVSLDDGGSTTTAMTWNASRNRWQKGLKDFASRFGGEPVSVTVSGVEGSESVPVD
jgi:bacillopeptidase F